MNSHTDPLLELPIGDDLGMSRGTDFYGLDERLDEGEVAIRDRVRQFCDTEVVPRAAAYWEAADMPAEVIQGYGGLGIAGGALQGHGCPGMTPLLEGIVVAELARGDGSLSTLNAVHSGLAMGSIGRLGSEEQKQRWLPAMATFERTGAFALTEPDHGSDVVTLETTASRDGDEWVLSGHKRWIGNGHRADLVVVWARDDDGKVGGFVVEHPDGVHDQVPGYHAVQIRGKAANRGIGQAQIVLDRVRIPAENRLAESRSFADTNRVLAKARQTVAWEGLGHAIAAYEAAVTYSLRREQFGRPIAKFQLIQDKLSHMLTAITAMQMVCGRLAELQSEGRATLEHAALAKLQTAAGARMVCSLARDTLGGNGILLDHHVARHHADIEAVYTYEGTDSIQSLIVGRAITGMSAFV
ncbi:MAG: acyl-CoA dehydrogenase family protein [Allobranchiibius sp.]